MGPCFSDRGEAGRRLSTELCAYRDRRDVLVLGLPRGGVPVAYEVACALHVELDVLVVRKLRAPDQPELALGALAAGVRVLDSRLLREARVDDRALDEITNAEQRELERAQADYGVPVGARKKPSLAIVVDDGLATGSSMLAAVACLRRQGIERIAVAVPVAAAETSVRVRREVDELVCLATPDPFRAVGCWYEDFSEVSAARVRHLLARARAAARRPG